MPRQNQPIIAPKGPFPVLPVAANALDFVFTACDPVNFDEFVFTGRELLIVKSGGAHTFTLESVSDEKGRTGDIATYSLGNGEFAVFWFGSHASAGWAQSTQKVNLKGSDAAIMFAVVRIPG